MLRRRRPPRWSLTDAGALAAPAAAGRAGRCCWTTRWPPARGRSAAAGRRRPARRARTPRLRHLHLRLDRPAQGRRGRARHVVAARRPPGRGCGVRRRRAARRPLHVAAAFDVSVCEIWRCRCCRRRARWSSRRPAATGPRTLAAPASRERGVTARAARAVAAPAPGRGRRRRGAPAPAQRRARGGEAAAARDRCRGSAPAAAGAAGSLNIVRPHRGHRRRHAPGAADRACRTAPRARSAGRSRTPAPYVLDAALRPAPVGRARRAVPRPAPGVARGYLGPARADRRALRARPVRPPPGARLYRTGDLVRWPADGDARVPRPDRRPGEDPRLPHRAGRDRGRAARRIPAVRRGGRRRARRTGRRRPAPGRPTSCRRPGAAPTAAALRGLLRARPARATWCPRPSCALDALPLTANGKVDRRALPAPDVGRRAPTGHVPPRTAAGARRSPRSGPRCCGVERVGVDDNFFELGGDSILSIQVVSRARQAGLRCPPRDLFAAPDHRRAGRRAPRRRAPAVAAEQGPGGRAGAADPDPALVLRPDPRRSPHHFNQSALLRAAPRTSDAAALRAALARAAGRTTTRCACASTRPTDGWRQDGSAPAGRRRPLQRGRPVRGRTPARAAAAPGAAAHAAQARASTWPPGRCCAPRCSDLGDGGPPAAAPDRAPPGGRRRLLADPAGGPGDRLPQAAAGEPVRPGRQDHLVRALGAAAGRARRGRAASTPKLRPLGGRSAAGPTPPPAGRRRRAATPPDAARTGHRAAGRERDPARCCRTVPARLPHPGQRRAADARSAGRWPAGPAGDRVLVDLEGHGREELFDGVDLSRTVGWFTSHVPGRAGPAGRRADWRARRCKSVKEQLRAVPRRGLGYGALRHLRPPAAAEPAPRPRAAGQLQLPRPVGRRGRAGGRPGPRRPSWTSARSRRRTRAAGAPARRDRPRSSGGRLELDLAYSAAVHDAATVRAAGRGRCSRALREIVAHCAAPGRRRPHARRTSRWPGWTRRRVDRLVGDGRAVEDIYPLTPHAGRACSSTAWSSAGRAPTSTRSPFVLDGVADPRALAAAWQQVVDRTPVLRTAVRLGGRDGAAAGRATRGVTLPVDRYWTGRGLRRGRPATRRWSGCSPRTGRRAST